MLLRSDVLDVGPSQFCFLSFLASRMKSVGEQRQLKGTETFSIVVVYEDTSTRNHAIRICDHLETKLGSETSFNFSWWKFDYLGDPFLSAEATAAAAQSDMGHRLSACGRKTAFR